jgi:16S rRNA G966 N2-methylase RsmD
MESKIRYYFNKENDAVINSILFDDVSLYSITRQDIANKMTDILLRLKDITPESSIVDATACIGGNSYSFAKAFHNVTAIEIDEARFKMLENNMSLFGVRENIHLVHGDCVAFLHSSPSLYDIVFFDPPWGGTEYASQAKIGLQLNGRCMLDHVIDLEGKAKYVAIKIPNNYHIHLLSIRLPHKKYRVFDDFYKMKLLIIYM